MDVNVYVKNAKDRGLRSLFLLGGLFVGYVLLKHGAALNKLEREIKELKERKED